MFVLGNWRINKQLIIIINIILPRNEMKGEIPDLSSLILIYLIFILYHFSAFIIPWIQFYQIYFACYFLYSNDEDLLKYFNYAKYWKITLLRPG